MMLKTLSTLAVAAAAASPSHAVVIEGFEGFADGAAIPETGSTATTTATTGITQGNVASTATLVGDSSYFKLGDVDLQDVGLQGPITQFTLDLTATGVTSSANANGGPFTQIVAGIFFDGTQTFRQVDGFKAGSGDSFIGDGDTGPLQFTYDAAGASAVFAEINTALAAGDAVEFGVYVNNRGTTAGTFVLDNIQADGVIPEPASAALVGLGTLALLGRRRK